MPPGLRVALTSGCVAACLVVGLGSADAQRAAVPRPSAPHAPAPQAHHAVPRPIPTRPLPGSHYYYRGPTVYRPYYASPYYWYGGFYGGYYSYPFYFSAGVGPYAPYYGYPVYPYYPWYSYDPAASLRLQVTPREAEVFIDGSYAGTVDDFDGSFQRLRLYPGEHTVEVFLSGHHTLTQRIYLQPGKTFTVRATLEPLMPGELEPVRPADRPDAQSRVPQAHPPANPPQNRDEDWRPQGGTQSGFGLLALRVQPDDATVTIDGEVWESSDDAGPLVLQLGTGVHRIEIRKQGYRSYVTERTVRPGETTTLNVAMTPNE